MYAFPTEKKREKKKKPKKKKKNNCFLKITKTGTSLVRNSNGCDCHHLHMSAHRNLIFPCLHPYYTYRSSFIDVLQLHWKRKIVSQPELESESLDLWVSPSPMDMILAEQKKRLSWTSQSRNMISLWRCVFTSLQQNKKSSCMNVRKCWHKSMTEDDYHSVFSFHFPECDDQI